MSAATEDRLACPVDGCEATFIRQNKSRHLKDVHGIQTGSEEYRRLVSELRPANAARAERVSSYSQQLDQRIHEIAKPLRDELRGINKRLSAIDMEGVELRASRKRIEQVLKQLDPTSFVAAPKKNNRPLSTDERNDEKRELVRQFLDENRDRYDDGLTAAAVYRDMKAAGVEPVAAPNRVKKAVEELHAQGVLRADKKIRGGAVQYKFVSNGGSADGS